MAHNTQTGVCSSARPSELETALWQSGIRTKAKGVLVGDRRNVGGAVLVLVRLEVGLENAVRLLVNVVARVRGQRVELLDALHSLHNQRKLVRAAGGLRVSLADLEDVLERLEAHSDDALVGAREQLSKRLDGVA